MEYHMLVVMAGASALAWTMGPTWQPLVDACFRTGTLSWYSLSSSTSSPDGTIQSKIINLLILLAQIYSVHYFPLTNALSRWQKINIRNRNVVPCFLASFITSSNPQSILAKIPVNTILNVQIITSKVPLCQEAQ